MVNSLIDSSYTAIDSSNLLPSFFTWLFGGALGFENGSIFGTGLLLMVGLISFFTFKGFRYEKAMMPSALITWLVSLLALKAGWIGNGTFSICCIYVVIAFYYLSKESSGEEA
jgi:phosphoglycerol transferase MdoB-like AlkP superfamily enzyme